MGIYYNENGDLQAFEETSAKVKCIKCKKVYLQHIEEQVPGFRDKSFDVCPYCKNENGNSMSVEYTNYKIE